MKVSGEHSFLSTANKILHDIIYPSRYLKTIPISNWQYAEYPADDAPKTIDQINSLSNSLLSPLAANQPFGGRDRTAWLKTTVHIPKGFVVPGAKAGINIIFKPSGLSSSSAEGLLYINKKPYQGLDAWHHEVFIDEADSEILDAGVLNLAIKLWCGLDDVKCVLGAAELINIHTPTDEFYFFASTVANCAQQLDENDLRRMKLTALLKKTFACVDASNPMSDRYYDSVETALGVLQQDLAELQMPEIKPLVHAVGCCGINAAWLWRLYVVRETTSRVYATVLNLANQFPEYVCMHTSPQLLKFLKADYPDIFARVLEKIQSGQLECTGGMWVEADTNLPSGESLIRQFLYGQKYLRDVLGAESKIVYLPDVCGYSAALSQIAKQSGIEYFLLAKTDDNPYDTFLWRGIDGTGVFTHSLYTCGAEMNPREIMGAWQHYQQKDITDQLLHIYSGTIRGRGGPTREMLMSCRVMEDIPGIPYVKPGKAEAYLGVLRQTINDKQLPYLDGELAWGHRQGIYTSQAYNKKANRYMERLLHDAEFTGVLRDLCLYENEYPKQQLDELWERVLLLQQHSIISGQSMREVYEDSHTEYERMRKRTEVLVEDSAYAINSELNLSKNSIVVYNGLSWKRDMAEIFIPYSDAINKNVSFLDEDGYTLESQATEDGLYVICTELPPLGYKSYVISNGRPTPADDFFSIYEEDGILHLESNYYHARFNGKGEITQLYDKLAKRDVNKGNLNALEVYNNNPWGQDFHANYGLTHNGLRVMEQGNLRTVLRREIKLNDSTINQDIIFYTHNMRIDFNTHVDWKEKQTILKATFPLDIRAANATYDIQFGFVERTNHKNSRQNLSQQEVCGHKWADVSESGYGVALFNDCKYGYECNDSVLKLTLINPSASPDAATDTDQHDFCYALYPHLGNLVSSLVQPRAAEFNNPAIYFDVPGGGVNNFMEFSLLRVGTLMPQMVDGFPEMHVIVDTVKKSEDGAGIVLRVYENNNRALKDAIIKWNDSTPFTHVVETNLLEEPLAEQRIKVKGQSIVFDINPFEVKTFVVYV